MKEKRKISDKLNMVNGNMDTVCWLGVIYTAAGIISKTASNILMGAQVAVMALTATSNVIEENKKEETK